jgi:hypothetical protein
MFTLQASRNWAAFRQEAVASVARCRVRARGGPGPCLPSAARAPPASPPAAPGRPASPANDSDVPSMSLGQQRCSIDAVCGRARAGGWGRGRGERGVRDMRCGTAGGANPACRGTRHRVAAVLLVWSTPYRPSEPRISGCIRTGPSPLRINSVLATPVMGSERRQAPWEIIGGLIFWNSAGRVHLGRSYQ